jgi:hypothetical protein
LIYFFTFIPAGHSLDYCRFGISLTIKKHETSNFVLVQDCFGYSMLLLFEYAMFPMAHVLKAWSPDGSTILGSDGSVRR